jgi:peptide/nickel transport system substrate-binding protein
MYETTAKEGSMKRTWKGNLIVWTVFLLTALLLIGVSVAPLSAAEPKPRYGGTMRLSDYIDGTFIGYPPRIVRSFANRQAAPAIETLLRTDKAGKPVPWLATVIKENAAAKTITLTLRKGVKFHDDTDFNADAVKWNLEQHMAAKAPGTERFLSVDVVNDYAVRINLSQWDSTVTSNLSQTLGMIVSPTAVKKNGVDWAASHPTGTGPFQFVSWEKDTRTVYKRFSGYWQKGKPYLDEIVWTPIADSLVRLLSLRRGELDLILSVAPKDLADFEKEGFIVKRPSIGSGATALVPDSANPKSPFADIRVRQAAQYAIDAEAIVKGVFSGEWEAANQWIYKGHWGYNASIMKYPYDPAKAKQLLAAAGYPNGFKTKLTYRTSVEWDQTFAAVQAYLKAVGIDTELDPIQSGKYDQLALQGGKWDGLLVNMVSPNPDVTAALAQIYSGGGKNFTQMLVPDDYVSAIQKAISASDFKTKQKWTQEALKLMADKYRLQIFLLARRDFAVSRPAIHNHGIAETPSTGQWTPEDAWVEPK